jgi:hypothetical protein
MGCNARKTNKHPSPAESHRTEYERICDALHRKQTVAMCSDVNHFIGSITKCYKKIREKFQHLLSVLDSSQRTFMVYSRVSFLSGCAVIFVKAIKAYVVRSEKSVFPSQKIRNFKCHVLTTGLRLHPSGM